MHVITRLTLQARPLTVLQEGLRVVGLDDGQEEDCVPAGPPHNCAHRCMQKSGVTIVQICDIRGPRNTQVCGTRCNTKVAKPRNRSSFCI
jgi:hypothetical protein